MNLWKSIEKEPPELNKGVLVTDGANVYFGRFTDSGTFDGIDTSGFPFLCTRDELKEYDITEYCYYKGEWSI